MIHNLHGLGQLKLDNLGVEVVFELDSPNTRELTKPQQLLPYLKDLKLRDMNSMTHVWKCSNWNEFFIPQKLQGELLSFGNLTTIHLERCYRIKYLFSPLMAKLLSNLKKIDIASCHGMEEVVSNRDDDENENMSISTSAHTLFPQLDSIELFSLENLKHIGGVRDGSNEVSFNNIIATLPVYDQLKVSGADVYSWSLCQYSREIKIEGCNALSSVIPCYALGHMQKLQVLEILECKSMIEVFETQVTNNNNIGGSSSGVNVDEGIKGGTDTTLTIIPGSKSIIMLKLPNLKILKIKDCKLLEHIFAFSTLESLRQLEQLSIKNCKAMRVIVTVDENGEQTPTTSYSSSKVVEFPHLKSLELVKLPNLEGFFLGKNDFQWPVLDYVMINDCPQIMMFTAGQSTAPKLNFIHTELGKHSLDLECGLNFHVTSTSVHHQNSFESLESGSWLPTSLEQLPWSLHNLMEMVVIHKYDVKKMIPSDEFLHLQKLEKIQLNYLKVEEVFTGMEELEGTNTTSVVAELPNLREVELGYLDNLKYIWKRNEWTVFKFPNLTKLCIFGCHELEHVFSSSMVGSLLQLQHLSVTWCEKLEVIVKEEEEDEECGGKVKEIEFPFLKSIQLNGLVRMKGFWLGKEAFLLPSLDTLGITNCPKMKVFTRGDLDTPALKLITIDYEEYYVDNHDLNSCIKDYSRT